MKKSLKLLEVLVWWERGKKNGLVDNKTKEFVALGIAISYQMWKLHRNAIEALIKLGTNRDELVEILAMCSFMGGGPSISFSSKALEAYDQLSS